MSICNVSLQIVPSVPEEEIYPVVDRVIEYVDQSGVNYVVGPMETTMEGNLSDLLKIIEEVQGICVDAGAKRVLSVVKIDFKPGGVTIDEKISKYRNK